MEEILHRTGRRRSAALFANLAKKVGLAKCSDESFLLFKRTLAVWFPEVETS